LINHFGRYTFRLCHSFSSSPPTFPSMGEAVVKVSLPNSTVGLPQEEVPNPSRLLH
jgi:hypothetical protein